MNLEGLPLVSDELCSTGQALDGKTTSLIHKIRVNEDTRLPQSQVEIPLMTKY